MSVRMARTYREKGTSVSLIVLLMLVRLVSSDITKDKEECANQLVGLATCLPYVGGEAKSPTLDCCTGLKQVLKTSKKCLCVLIRDRDDPSLGLKINATMALGLPAKCHATAADGDISQCPALLHLAPNSPDAKVFTDFGKAAAPTSSTTAPAAANPTDGAGNTTSAKGSSKNGASSGWSIAQMIYGMLFMCVTCHFIF